MHNFAWFGVLGSGRSDVDICVLIWWSKSTPVQNGILSIANQLQALFGNISEIDDAPTSGLTECHPQFLTINFSVHLSLHDWGEPECPFQLSKTQQPPEGSSGWMSGISSPEVIQSFTASHRDEFGRSCLKRVRFSTSFRLEYVASEPDSHAEAGQTLHKSAAVTSSPPARDTQCCPTCTFSGENLPIWRLRTSCCKFCELARGFSRDNNR